MLKGNFIIYSRLLTDSNKLSFRGIARTNEEMLIQHPNSALNCVQKRVKLRRLLDDAIHSKHSIALGQLAAQRRSMRWTQNVRQGGRVG